MALLPGQITFLQQVARWVQDTGSDPASLPVVRIIEGQNAGQGMPKDKKIRENVLAHSFHLQSLVDALDSASPSVQHVHSKDWRANTKWRAITAQCMVHGD